MRTLSLHAADRRERTRNSAVAQRDMDEHGFVVGSSVNAALLHMKPGHADLVSALALSPDCRLLATGDRGGVVHAWGLHHASMASLPAHRAPIAGLGIALWSSEQEDSHDGSERAGAGGSSEQDGKKSTEEVQIVRQPEVQKVSSIGKLRASRRVDLREMTPEQLPKGREVTYGDHGDGKAGMVQVTDVYEDGDWCEEHGVHRTTEVQIRCCPEETEAHGERTQLLHVHEVEKAPCTYAALVCAPILCTDSFERLLDERIDAGSAKEGTGKNKQRLNLKMTRTGTKRRRKKTESVRDILDRILGKMCLRKNAGWWTYELCHGKIAREFHGTEVLDANTGASRLVIEEEHLIGRYHAEEHEAYPDVEEALHVVNATADDESEAEGDGSSGRTGREGGRKKDAAAVGGLAAVSPPSDAGGNGSVFVQEYIDGLACNDSDVADSVIRGNNVVGGSIQRSVTIRYSCGKKYELVRVNEDTTCHYVFDVTVPALCGHPLFKAEMARTQVVKCLPVE